MKNKNIIYISIFLFLVLLTGCAIGHAHNYSIEWEFGEEVIATFTCDCGLHSTQKILASTEEEIIIEADCLNEGKKNVTAKVMFNNILYEETKLMTIPKMGHNIVSHESKAATCTEKGWEAYEKCTRCDYTTYKEIAALNHNIVSHESKAATCTENGNKEYYECSGCHTYYADAEGAIEIPKSSVVIDYLGHDPVYHEAKAATCTEKGWEAYEECTRCDYTTYREIVVDHNIVSTVIKPGLITEGYTIDSCSDCDYLYKHSYISQILNLELEDDYYVVTGVNDSGIVDITIPETYNDLPVKAIGAEAFRKYTSLTSVTIGNNVTSIGDYAFSDCDSLTNIIIPDSVTSIGEYTFYYCRSLKNIIIPEGVTSIGDYAFYDCRSLKNIIIPESVTSIGEYTFYYCGMLTNITIPDSVTSIGDSAFEYCRNLTNITIPESVTSIGDSAFKYCASLIDINVSVNNNNYQSINGNLYSKDGMTLIQYSNGKKDNEFIIPKGVTNIGSGAFYFCRNLTNIIIPESVTSIGDSAFYRCDNLTNITIPDSVTSIGDSAFYTCFNLTNIIIPDSVISIGDSAFIGCYNLIIYCKATSKPIGWDYDWNPNDRPVVWGYK